MNDNVILEKNLRGRTDHRFLLELLAVGFVLLLMAKLSYDLPASRDLPSTDEPGYLVHGDEMEQIGLPPAAWSPLYVAFYYAESLVTSDRIDLFDRHWLIVTALLTLSGYFVMRCLRVSRPLALCGTFLILGSNFIFVDPMPPHLATVILGAGTAIALLFRQPSSSLAIAGITLAVASLIRPELAPLLIVSLVVCLIIGGVGIYRTPRQWKSIAGSVAVFGVSVAALFQLFGNPTQDSRGFEAFGQHYAYNVWQYGEKINHNPWLLWKDYTARDFPGAETIGQAVRINPGAFAWHIQQNLVNFWKYFHRVIDLRLGTPRWLSRLFLAGWILAGFAGMTMSVRRLRQERLSPADWPWAFLLILAVVLIQVAVTSVLIYPVPHYYISICFFLFILTSWGIDQLLKQTRWKPAISNPRVLIFTGVLLLASLPNRTHGWTPQQLLGLRDSGGSPPILVFRDISRTLQEVPIRQPVTILGQDSVFTRYANIPFREIMPTEARKSETFWDYLDQHQVTLAIFHAENESKLFGENPLDRPPDEFRLYQVKNSRFWIAVNKQLLQERIALR